MAMGIVNVPGGDAVENADQINMTGYVKPASASAISPTDSVMEAIGKLEAAEKGGIPVAEDSSVAFSLGCDNNGVYMVTPDENEEEGVAE